MRILKGYSKEERKELEEAKDNAYYSSIDLISGIVGEDDDCTSLTSKYYNGGSEEDNQLTRDIVDFYTGKAKFPEQKYYVQLIKGKNESYLKRDMLRNFCTTGGWQPDSTQFQIQFTAQEIKDIDPRYMAFAVPVEDDDE